MSDTAETGDATTSPEAEVGPETEVSPEVVEVAEETSSSVCALGCIPVSAAAAPLGVAFVQFDQVPRLRLSGGEAPQGDWDLVEIEIYSQGTFADGIEVRFSNHGATRGRVTFGGDAMAMALELDMDVTVTAFGSTNTSNGANAIELGGCHEARDGKLVGDLGACPNGTPGQEGALDYELNTSLLIGVELTRDQLIALLPPDQQDAASFAIVGPLYMVAELERP